MTWMWADPITDWTDVNVLNKFWKALYTLGFTSELITVSEGDYVGGAGPYVWIWDPDTSTMTWYFNKGPAAMYWFIMATWLEPLTGGHSHWSYMHWVLKKDYETLLTSLDASATAQNIHTTLCLSENEFWTAAGFNQDDGTYGLPVKYTYFGTPGDMPVVTQRAEPLTLLINNAFGRYFLDFFFASGNIPDGTHYLAPSGSNGISSVWLKTGTNTATRADGVPADVFTTAIRNGWPLLDFSLFGAPPITALPPLRNYSSNALRFGDILGTYMLEAIRTLLNYLTAPTTKYLQVYRDPASTGAFDSYVHYPWSGSIKRGSETRSNGTYSTALSLAKTATEDEWANSSEPVSPATAQPAERSSSLTASFISGLGLYQVTASLRSFSLTCTLDDTIYGHRVDTTNDLYLWVQAPVNSTFDDAGTGFSANTWNAWVTDEIVAASSTATFTLNLSSQPSWVADPETPTTTQTFAGSGLRVGYQHTLGGVGGLRVWSFLPVDFDA